MRGDLRTRQLDPDLDILYGNCLDYMSATEAYLSNLDLLDNRKNTGTLLDVFSSLWNGYKTGSDVSSAAGKLGLSEENAANAGKLVGAANAAADLYSKIQSRDANYRAAISEAAAKLEDRWNTTWASLQAVSRRMSSKYGWPAGEAGFDGFQSPQLADLLARSPRDPFLKARYGDGLLENAKTPNDCITATNAYLEAAELVPSDTSYDSLRLQYVADATEAAVEAPSIEAGNRGYSARPSSWPVALKLARTYVSMDPQDTTGFGHAELARALAFAGRYEEGASSATTAYRTNKSLENDSSFCYRYAKLMSLTNNLDLVQSWLQQAYKDGFHEIAALRTDPDFESFRSQRSQSFSGLTNVIWGWDIDYGVVLDDVIVTNKSAFDLTNVVVQVHVRKGSSRWDPVIKCAVIKAGSSCKGENVMSVTGNSYDAATASLSSDQS